MRQTDRQTCGRSVLMEESVMFRVKMKLKVWS